MRFKFIFLFFILSLIQTAQNSLLTKPLNDLYKDLTQCTSDTAKANMLCELGQYYLTKDIDSAKYFLKEAQKTFPPAKVYVTAKENIYKCKVILLEANVLLTVAKLTEAEKLFYDLLTKHDAFLSPSQKAVCFLQLGVIADYQSRSVTSLKYYTRAYKLFDSLHDPRGTSECLNNMGVIFYKQEEYDKGIEYLEKSLAIRLSTGQEKSLVAMLYANLGNMYLKSGNASMAKTKLDEGYKLFSEDKDQWGISYSLKNLANYFIYVKDYDRAFEYANQLKNKLTNGDSSGMVMVNALFSKIHFKKGDCQKSLEHANAAYNMAKYLNVAVRMYEAVSALKDANTCAGNYKEALEFTNIYIALKDSLTNNKASKESLKQRLEYEKEVEQELLKKDLKIKEAEAKQKNLILVFVSAGLVLIVLFSGLLLKKFRETKKQKKIIEDQKLEVEHKQKEIVDSINYAKRIQQALLPTQKYISKSIHRLKN